jgi:ABC-type glycerol-3-phosphate transport system substrate-binding protein
MMVTGHSGRVFPGPLWAGTVVFILWALAFNACRGDKGIPPLENTEENRIIKIVTPSEHSVRALYEIAGRFSLKHPSFTAEVSLISGTTPVNAFLASKFAVGDVPDVFIYQAGNSSELYAQGGHLLDLSGGKFEDRFFPGTDTYCRYKGRLYALPLDISISGLFVQMSVLWQGAVKNSEVRVIPRTFDEFIESCEKLRAAGIRYPVVLGAASDTGAAFFLYQYIYQNIYAENPKSYEQMLLGGQKWTDQEFRDMYRIYGMIRRYMNPDAARINSTEAIRRFVEGEAAYYIGISRDIAHIRRIKRNADVLLVTPPWVNDTSRALPVSWVDMVVSGSSATEYPEEVKAFLREFTSVYGADLYAQAVGSISTVIDSSVWYDSSLGPQNTMFTQGGLWELMSRRWLPGFEDIFRRLNQEWFTGRSADSVLEEMERIHRRMTAAERTGL